MRNYNIYSYIKPQRDRKQGLLKPLPIPNYIQQEISIDFIIDLPRSLNYINLIVITNYLSKGVILTPLKNLEIEIVAQAFIRVFYSKHSFPLAIISN